jgi:F-box and WD-40 domain protein 5
VKLFNFFQNNSTIFFPRIAYCPWLDDHDDDIDPEAGPSTQSEKQPNTSQEVRHSGNPVSKIAANPSQQSRGSSLPRQVPETEDQDYERPINYSEEFRRDFEEPVSQSSSDLDEFIDDVVMTDDDLYEDLDEACPKYLIFSTGSRTYTPHQIGIKRVGKVNFPKKLEPGPSIQERIALRDRRRELEAMINSLSPEEARLQFQHFALGAEPNPDPDWVNYDAVANRFDSIDALIDLEGHIIGMGLSPCNRFLYVNSRPWPQNCVIANPLDPPPISQEIDIHVIDLQSLKKVGTMLRAHKAYTPNTECFFIFLDVSENFVGSGAEDKHAYSWDRYYGICLASYPHTDVVNSVAFNPKDDQMLITTSDDYEIKIWRSQASIRDQGIAGITRANEVKNKQKKKPETVVE